MAGARAIALTHAVHSLKRLVMYKLYLASGSECTGNIDTVSVTQVEGPLSLDMRADRSLSRVRGLPVNVRSAALTRFKTCREVLNFTEHDLIQELDLFLPEVRALLHAVALHVTPPPVSALGLLRGECAALGKPRGATGASIAPTLLPTGLAALDAHLGGGLPMRALTELVGPAGAGKTQLCLSVAARALLDGAADGLRVLYVDTEGSFSPSRLLQLLLARGAASHAEELMRRLTVFKPAGWAEYCTCLQEQLESELLTPPRVSLVIVDSIAMAVHRQFDKDKEDVQARQAAVGAHAARLKHYADTHAAAVVCVNQVVGAVGSYGPTAEGDVSCVQGSDDSQLLAYLGTAWAHFVNLRLALQHPLHAVHMPLPPLPPAQAVGASAARSMVLRVVKAPMCAEAAFGYAVSAAGLEARSLSGSGGVHTV